MKYLTFLIVLSCFTSIQLARSQELISSGGAIHKGSGAILFWSIGEPVVESFNGTASILTQGFQQSQPTATAISRISFPDLSLEVYPNPTSDFLYLKVIEEEPIVLQYTLVNLLGKILSENEIHNSLTEIDLQPFPSGIYMLKIRSESGEFMQTIKILKN